MLRHSFSAGGFALRQQSFFFRASFGTCTIAVPFVAFVGSLVLVSDLLGLCLGKSLTTVCFGICWCSGGHCWSRVKVFFFGMGLLVV